MGNGLSMAVKVVLKHVNMPDHNTDSQAEYKHLGDGNVSYKRSFYLIEFKWRGMFEVYPALFNLDQCYKPHITELIQWWEENKHKHFMPVDEVFKFMDSLQEIPFDNKGHVYVVGVQLDRIRQAFRLKCHDGNFPIPMSMTVQFVEGYQHFIYK